MCVCEGIELNLTLDTLFVLVSQNVTSLAEGWKLIWRHLMEAWRVGG